MREKLRGFFCPGKKENVADVTEIKPK